MCSSVAHYPRIPRTCAPPPPCPPRRPVRTGLKKMLLVRELGLLVLAKDTVPYLGAEMCVDWQANARMGVCVRLRACVSVSLSVWSKGVCGRRTHCSAGCMPRWHLVVENGLGAPLLVHRPIAPLYPHCTRCILPRDENGHRRTCRSAKDCKSDPRRAAPTRASSQS